jgi:hypothetical protein
MSRRTTLTITVALGLALAGGAGTIRPATAATSGEAISTIRAIDPDQNLVVLSDGLHLVVADPATLDALHEGEVIQVQYTEQAGQYVIDRIAQVDREPSPYDQMKVGEGQSTGARPIKRGSDTFSASPTTSDPSAYDGAPEPEAP